MGVDHHLLLLLHYHPWPHFGLRIRSYGCQADQEGEGVGVGVGEEEPPYW